jgi:hypothetical protein
MVSFRNDEILRMSEISRDIYNIERKEVKKIKKFTLRFDDEQQHQEFKIKTIRSNTSMQKELIKMVEQYLKKEENNK